MFSQLAIKNEQGDQLTIDLSNPDASYGIVIKKISGIGSPEVDSNISEYVTVHGGKYGNPHANTRDIKIEFYLVGSDLETTRIKLYQVFHVSDKVTLYFYNTYRTLVIEGVVTSNDIDIFTTSRNDFSSATVKIECPQPFFHGLGETPSVVATSYGGLVFPLAINASGVEFSSRSAGGYCYIDNDGDAEVGAIFTMAINDTQTDNIVITNTTSDMAFTILSTAQLTSGDVVTVSTIPGDKYITIVRSGDTINGLKYMGMKSKWLKLKRGRNEFTITGADMTLSVSANVLYEGV